MGSTKERRPNAEVGDGTPKERGAPWSAWRSASTDLHLEQPRRRDHRERLSGQQRLHHRTAVSTNRPRILDLRNLQVFLHLIAKFSLGLPSPSLAGHHVRKHGNQQSTLAKQVVWMRVAVTVTISNCIPCFDHDGYTRVPWMYVQKRPNKGR